MGNQLLEIWMKSEDVDILAKIAKKYNFKFIGELIKKTLLDLIHDELVDNPEYKE